MIAVEYLGPTWVQIIVYLAAIVTALGVIWRKAVKPFVRMVSLMEVAVPLITDLSISMRDTPDGFKVLDQIIAQFRTDSGSSLRDVVNRLETASKTNELAAIELKIQAGISKELAEDDRKKLNEVMIALGRLAEKTERAAQEASVNAVRSDLQSLDAARKAEINADNALTNEQLRATPVDVNFGGTEEPTVDGPLPSS